jgi:hypothetical protein
LDLFCSHCLLGTLFCPSPNCKSASAGFPWACSLWWSPSSTWWFWSRGW